MNLPCWIKHKWGKYGEPFEKTTNYFNDFNRYQYSIKRTYQARTCEKCGIVDKTVLDTATFDRNCK